MALEAVAAAPGTEARDPAPALRETFKRAAKLVHPDLAPTDAERQRRTALMTRINEAYTRGDLAAIEAIISDEQGRPEVVTGDDVGARLVRVLRQISQVRRRLDELSALEAALRDDPLWRLYEVVVAARAQGRDRLGDLEADLRSRIASAQARLAALALARPQPGGDQW